MSIFALQVEQQLILTENWKMNEMFYLTEVQQNFDF